METINRPDLDLVLLQDLEFEIQCESTLSHHQHAHKANWVVIYKECGCSANLCESRRQEATADYEQSIYMACHRHFDMDFDESSVSWLPIEK